MAETAAALSVVSAKLGWFAAARSTKSATAGMRANISIGEGDPLHGNGRGISRNTRSPRTRKPLGW